MSAYAEEFKNRTKEYALRIIRLVSSLPRDPAARRIGDQLLRAGTSVGANYRAACRARSKADFCSKMGIVEEEADESVYWLEIIVAAKMMKKQLVTDLIREGCETTAVVVSSINTTRRNMQRVRK